jgi:hypothetical protein
MAHLLMHWPFLLKQLEKYFLNVVNTFKLEVASSKRRVGERQRK